MGDGSAPDRFFVCFGAVPSKTRNDRRQIKSVYNPLHVFDFKYAEVWDRDTRLSCTSKPVGSKSIGPNCWPRDSSGKHLWPNHLTLQEECLRLAYGGIKNPPWHRSGHVQRVSYRQLDQNPILIQSIVRFYLIGIRIDKVPYKYHQYFAHRWGFLIPYDGRLPLRLVRLIEGVWKKDPTALWLLDQAPLRTVLRTVPKRIVEYSSLRATRIRETLTSYDSWPDYTDSESVLSDDYSS